MISTFTHRFIDIASTILVQCAGLAILAVAWMYVVDRTQTKQTIRRNFPVIGRFRYLFEHLGEFFRQYFFAMDREDCPSTAPSGFGSIAPPERR